jgi:hypothetical protein
VLGLITFPKDNSLIPRGKIRGEFSNFITKKEDYFIARKGELTDNLIDLEFKHVQRKLQEKKKMFNTK